jgi:hypothetical protein
MDDEKKKLYRYYDVQYSAGIDQFDNDLGPGRVGVHLMEFDIIKETKCGVWILYGDWIGSPDEIPSKEFLKFINLEANKQFACRTKEEAKQSFISRKRRQLRILNSQIIRAEKALIVADQLKI